MPDPSPEAIAKFIERWEKSGGSEMANYQLFLTELCDEILLVPHPEPAGPDNAANLYTFERGVTFKEADGSQAKGRIDLYKSTCFLLETKQGTFSKAKEQGTLLDFIPAKAKQKTGHGKRGTAAFDKVLQRAYNQGRKYITALPAAEGRPPFLIVCDVGHSIELYAEFTGTGGQYERFPDPVSHRTTLADLHRPEIRERLRKVWTDPLSLDPSKHAAAVTQEVAKALAELAKSLEKDGHDPKVTAGFLQRCLFTMFAEDVGLLPGNSFLGTLEKVKDTPAGFPVMLQALWSDMAKGTPFSTILLGAIPHFNGGLFEDTTALPLRADQMALLMHAAKSDWSAVEPAIFGTLVERALDPRERHKLGAHYTPRSYVERLIRPALIDPLRAEWDTVKAAASLANEKAAKAEAAAAEISEDAKQHIQALDKTKAADSNKRHKDTLKQAAAHHEEALAAVRDFHRKLCNLRVLDPACGSGNFLYVSLELMKRLEAEVLEAFEELGGDAGFEMASFKIGPRQFLGLELNRRAVAIAQLVLWIGFFQWQRKTTGKADTNERPLLPKTPSIVQQDAVLAYDEAIPRKDPDTGEVVTIWDGITTKLHPITGNEVPDDSTRKVVFDYTNPRRAEWPAADVIVGNPPFIGNKRLRDALGEGYVEALRRAWATAKPDSWDFVMFWWHQAANRVQAEKCHRFGFITTNSISQSYGRRCIDLFLNHPTNPGHLAFVVPDHPWVDSSDGAAVRISMTVGSPGTGTGLLAEVADETPLDDESMGVALRCTTGVISSDFKIDSSLGETRALAANSGLAFMGVKLVGEGFVLTDAEAGSFLAHRGSHEPPPIRPLVSGRDLNQTTRGMFAIDLFGYTEASAREKEPALFQHLLTTVKPKRDQDKRKSYRDNWWIFAEPRSRLRKALAAIPRMIATSEVSKHRFFCFVKSSSIADGSLIVIAHPDHFVLSMLSSAPHVIFTLASCGALEDRPRYQTSRCFETFPFPALEEGHLKQRIRDLGEQLDAHRKRQQELHPDLTLTGLYNVLEAVRVGRPLNPKEKAIHDKGLVSILKQLHDDLDTAVLEAYGWQDLPAAAEACSGGLRPTLAKEEALQLPANGTGAHRAPLQSAHSPDAETARPQAPLADHLARGGESAEALEQTILSRLVTLNHERAAEEKRGLVRWLRPDYQAPGTVALPAEEQDEIQLSAGTTAAKSASLPDKLAWPDGLAAQVAAVQKLVPALGPDPEAIAARFGKKSAKRAGQVAEILETLRGLGKL